jgi:hypothetical protein
VIYHVRDKKMIQLIILIALSIALFKNINSLKQEKDFIIADKKGKVLFAPVMTLPFLYLVPFALSIVPILPLPILLVVSIILYIPGILVTRKAKLVFETGCDRSFEISKKLDVLFAIGVAGLILTIALPLLILVIGSVLLRNP